MDIAVFLPFGLVFGSNHHTAGAFEQSAVGHWLSAMVLLPKTPLGNHHLYLVKQFFAHKWGVFALVLFTSVHEVSVIKRIGQNLFDLICFIHLAAFGFDTTRKQIVAYVLKTTFVPRIQLKYLNHQRSACLVYVNSLGFCIVVIAKRGIAGVFAAPHFLAQAALGVLGQIVYIVFALPKSNIEHKLALRGVFKPKGLKL